MDSNHELKPSRRQRDRDPAQPTDFAERMVAFQRRNAVYVLFLSYITHLLTKNFIVCSTRLVQLVPANALSERRHLHLLLVCNLQILIRHLFLPAALPQRHLHARLTSHLMLSSPVQRQTQMISHGASRYLRPLVPTIT
jgi:hypothetical protein